MRLNNFEQRELGAGRTIARRFRIKSTGEVVWADIKRSWDILYYSVDDGPWCRTLTDALARTRAY